MPSGGGSQDRSGRQLLHRRPGDGFPPHQAFCRARPDGSFSDFSFIACIDGRTDQRDRLEALRRAVEEQIIEFRERCFADPAPLRCPLRGVPITRQSYHIDHAPPDIFQVLVDTWLAQHGLDLREVQITPPGDNQIVAQMTDPRQIAAWTDFHRSRANLRMLNPTANLSDAKRGQPHI